MILLLRAVCSTAGLVGVFFGSYYLFNGQYNAGIWAIIAGALFLFIGNSLAEIPYDEEDNDRDNFA